MPAKITGQSAARDHVEVVLSTLREESRTRSGFEGPDNSDRARWAFNAVAAYAIQNRYSTEAVLDEEDTDHLEEVVGDFLDDLMHALNGLGLDFDELAERGRYHFTAELEEAAQAEKEGA